MSISPGSMEMIIHGSYVDAIQRALGSPGASTTVNISGHPSSNAAVVVSLSAQAQQTLSNGKIALELIDRARSDEGSRGERAAPRISSSRIPSFNTIRGTTAANAGTNCSSSTASVDDLKAQARVSLTNPEAVFRAVVDAKQGDLETVVAFRSDAERQAFQAAYANGTVTFQNASDVEELQYRDSTVITGTSEETHISYNGDWQLERDKATDTYSGILCFPMVGAVFFTFPKLLNPKIDSG